MRIYRALILLLLFPILTLAFVVPDRPTSFVEDYAGVLSGEEKSLLATKVSDFEKNTTNEIAIVIIQSLDGDAIENVAQEIFTKWGIGKKDKNNGVLLLVSLTDRKTRLHTGYGVEGDLTDIGTSYIQSEVVAPAFREGRYFDGIKGAVDKMIEALGGANIVPEDYSIKNLPRFPLDFIFIMFIVLSQIVTSILARSKSWWGGGVLFGIIGLIIWHFLIYSILLAIPLVVVLIGLGLVFDYFVSKAYSERKNTGSYPWWFGGGRGGGSSGFGGGGGFGGFGGGMSGGGGSSGRW